MTGRRRWIAAACLLFAPSSPATPAGPPPDAAPAARTDCFGDPLPDGAVARMGTVRFRHSGAVEFVSFLPDGKTILSFGKDETLRWWDGESGKELRRWTAPATLWCAAPSPDRRVLALRVGDDVVLRDAASGKQLWKVEKPDARLSGVAFSPDRKLVATCGERIRLWDAITGERVREFDVSEGPNAAVAFLPDARTLVSTGRDGLLRWWDIETGKVVHEDPGRNGGGRLVAAAPDGKRAATAGPDHVVRLWDADKRTELCSLSPSAPDQEADCLAFSPDGKMLAVGWYDGAIRLYYAADGSQLRRWQAHQDAVSALAFSPNGALLVSGGGDSAVRQWDVASGMEVRPFAGAAGQVRALAVAPDGKTVASAGIDRRVHLWDAASGEQQRSLEASDDDVITLLGFSPNGRRLTAVGRGGGNSVLVWDVADSKERSAFSLTDRRYSYPFALSPDASLVAAFDGPDENEFAILDTSKGEILSRRQENGARRLLQLGAFLDDKTLAVFRHSDDLSAKAGSLLLWDAAAGVGVNQPLKAEIGYAFCVTASPDGKILAAAGSDGVVRLCNVSTGEVIRGFKTGTDFVLVQAFSADGRTLATSDLNGAVSLWETASGARRVVLKGGQGFIDALAFSPDGRRFYTGGHDGSVLAWDLTDRDGAAAADLGDKALARLWNDLGGDAGQAYQAVWTLAESPRRSVPYLKERLTRPSVTQERIAGWITDLDADDFETRERASADLRSVDEAAEEALRAAGMGRPSPEARRRIDELLEWVHKARTGLHPTDVRVVRAVEALENAATPEAREALAALAEGRETSLTRETKAALERLRRRGGS